MILMNVFKKIIATCLILAISVSLFALIGCSSGEECYTVYVKDAFGNPCTNGIIVKFMDGDKQVAMQSVNDKGIATKTLESGTYGIAVTTTDDGVKFHYDTEIEVSSGKTEVDVILAYEVNKDLFETISVGADEFDAYYVNSGCTYVDLKKNSKNYFLFSPTVAGNYEFSIPEGKNVKIGYYGSPHFVQEENTADVKDNKFTINVKTNMIGTSDTGTSIFVIGLDSTKDASNCVLGINRLSDPIKTIEDEPWTTYKTTSELKEYKLPSNFQIKEFDLTASTNTYKMVYNENDGFYHLNDKSGPIVLVRLAKDCKYIDCFKTILDKTSVVKYFFDDKENFIKKENYSDCLLEYIEFVDDKNGVYPLTKDLKYIIENHGEYVGWWDSESITYRFKDEAGNNLTNINNEIAWLLMCCYAE